MDSYMIWMETKVMGKFKIHRNATVFALTNVNLRNITEQRK